MLLRLSKMCLVRVLSLIQDVLGFTETSDQDVFGAGVVPDQEEDGVGTILDQDVPGTRYVIPN